MVKMLLDATIIVALVTLIGVIFSSLIAPLILKWLDTCPEEGKEPGE